MVTKRERTSIRLDHLYKSFKGGKLTHAFGIDLNNQVASIDMHYALEVARSIIDGCPMPIISIHSETNSIIHGKIHILLSLFKVLDALYACDPSIQTFTGIEKEYICYYDITIDYYNTSNTIEANIIATRFDSVN